MRGEQIALGLAFTVPGTLFSNPRDFVVDINSKVHCAQNWSFPDLIKRYINLLEDEDPRIYDAKLIREAYESRNSESEISLSSTIAVMRQLVGKLPDIGLQQVDIEFEIVDQFPAPYQSQKFSVMNYDKMDEKLYGIPPKITFLENMLAPYYSPIIFAHELIHALIGKIPRALLARGLEDGLADVVGSLVLAREVIEYSQCETCLHRARLHFPQEQFWANYKDAMFQAFLIHQKIGLRGIIEIINNANHLGRNYIKVVEEQFLTGNFNQLAVEKSDPDAQLESSFATFIGFPQNLAVSLAAYKLASNIEIGMTLSEVSSIERRLSCQGAYLELKRNAFLVVDDGKRVTINEARALLDIKALRYVVSK